MDELETVKVEDESRWPSTPLSRAQRAALQRIHSAHSDRPRPTEHQSPQAALRQLLKQGSAYGGPS